MRYILSFSFFCFSFLFLNSVFGQTVPEKRGILLEHMWARASVGDVPTLALYGHLKNFSDTDDVLVGASSPFAKAISFQRTTIEPSGYFSMHQLKHILLPKAHYVQLEPGDLHLMAMRVKYRLKPGDEFPLKLFFKKSPAQNVRVKVYAPSATWEDVAADVQDNN